MKRSKTSKQWMREHVSDVYVQRAKAEGYRSRAAFKLMEIAARDRLFRQSMIVVDLGATPGGWSQVAASKVGTSGRVIAFDILPMEPLKNVTFVHGDFREESAIKALANELQGRAVDLVLSDMSPNISGIALSDQARAMYLAELALEFAIDWLKPGGSFLVKVFQGSGFQEYLGEMRKRFAHVLTRKPDASRGRSNELYLLGRDLKARV